MELFANFLVAIRLYLHLHNIQQYLRGIKRIAHCGGLKKRRFQRLYMVQRQSCYLHGSIVNGCFFACCQPFKMVFFQQKAFALITKIGPGVTVKIIVFQHGHTGGQCIHCFGRIIGRSNDES